MEEILETTWTIFIYYTLMNWMPIYTIKKITRQSYFESYWCFLSFNALLIKNVNVLLIFPIFPFFNLFVNKHLKERLKDLIHLSNSSTHYSSKCYQFDSWQFIELDCLKLLFSFKKRKRFCDVEQTFRLLVNLLDEVFVISGIMEVKVGVISRAEGRGWWQLTGILVFYEIVNND